VKDNACIENLIAQEKLPASYDNLVHAYWRPLAAKIAAWKGERKVLVVGVNGGQGSGKTTLCKFLERCLLPELGLTAVTVSLDDFYLGKAARQKLGETVHPLFATRGAPGTHDAQQIFDVLSALKSGEPVTLPVFDKAADDIAPKSRWRTIDGPVDVVLFEGWCVGVAPQDEAALATPVNALEREEDKGGRWRRAVNGAIVVSYLPIYGLTDRLIMLRPKDMSAVLENRLLQERKLREANPGGKGVMSEAQVTRFIQYYERLTRWMIEELPSRADAVFELDELKRAQED